MRIIAGIAKGQPLAVPRGAQVRPTSDRVRAAIFSSLGERVVGATVLDLFAGSGALGLEAASRGARAVTFVENSVPALRGLEANLAAFRRHRPGACELVVVRGAVATFLRNPADRKFSLIFADPPYGDAAQALVAEDALPELLGAEGLFVLESARRSALVLPTGWRAERDAVYGDTRVSFWRRPPATG